MANKRAIMTETLDLLAKGFQKSRGITDKLTTKQMIAFAEEPTASGENKLAALVDNTLTEITAEDLEGVTQIKNYAFYYAFPIKTIQLPDTITTIGKYSFYQSGITNIVFPNSITNFNGDNICGYCGYLTSVVLPENSTLTAIPSNMFSYASSLDNVVIPNNFLYIQSRAFSGCESMTNITLSSNLIEIGDYAFSYCIALNNLTIPASITTLRSYALSIGSNKNKATITFLGTTPPTITTYTFNANYLNKIIVPVGCGEAYKSATNWANFADFIEEASV